MTQSNLRQALRARTGHRVGTVLAVGLMAGLLAACNAHDRAVTNAIPLTNVEDRHPILQAGDFAILDLPVGKRDGRMNSREKVDLEVFLHGYRQHGAGPLYVAMPQGTANEQAAVKRVGEVRAVAYRMGVPDDAIMFEPYTPYEGEHSFPVSLKYQVHKMVVPQCGNVSQNLAVNPRNLPYDNFGCSQQRNLAKMVANPADLRHPRPMDKRYGVERDRVLERYGTGEQTQSGNNQDNGGNIADVGE